MKNPPPLEEEGEEKSDHAKNLRRRSRRGSSSFSRQFSFSFSFNFQQKLTSLTQSLSDNNNKEEMKSYVPNPEVQKYFFDQTVRNARQNKFNYCLGFFACFIVVLVVCLMISVLNSSPAIFLRLAELSAGEVDLELTAATNINPFSNSEDSSDSSTVTALLNYTMLSNWLEKINGYNLHSPRHSFDLSVISSNECDAGLDPLNDTWKYLTSPSTSQTKRKLQPNMNSRYLMSSTTSHSSTWFDWFEQFCKTSVDIFLPHFFSEKTLDSLRPRINLPNSNPSKKVASRFLSKSPSLPTTPQSNIDRSEQSSCSGTVGQCFYDNCPNGLDFRGTLYLIDSVKEKNMDLGRVWNYAPLDSGEAYIHQSLASALNVKTGDWVYLSFSGSVFLHSTWSWYLDGFFSNTTIPVTDWVFLPVQIKDIYPTTLGKLPNSETKSLIMEYQYFMSYFSQHINPMIPPSTRAFFGAIDLYEYAGSIVANIQNRVPEYSSSNFDLITQRITNWASEFLYDSGFNLLGQNLPVLSSLQSYRFFGLFLGLMLNIIVIVLVALSILLIYSLLMVQVEGRTFETGILRMQGMTLKHVVELLLFQAFGYSIPALIAGLIVSKICFVVVSGVFQHITAIPISSRLSQTGIIVAVVLGLFIPMVASILPIKNALGKNILSAIDLRHSKLEAIIYKIHRSEDSVINYTVMMLGAILAIFGFVVYYVFPLALLTNQPVLLMNMFFLLLLLMLLGLVILSSNLQMTFDRFLIYLFFWWEKESLRDVLKKNMIAHRIRNRKTELMYSMSLAFIIFVVVFYAIQIHSITYYEQQINGSFLKVTADIDKNTYLSYTEETKQRLEAFTSSQPDLVVSTSWVSQSLQSCAALFDSLSNTNLGHAYSDSTAVYGVSENLFRTTISGFVQIHSQQDHKYDYMDDLYSVEGSASVWMGAMYLDFLNLKNTGGWEFINQQTVKGYSGAGNIKFDVYRRLRVSTFFNSGPIFGWSDYPSRTGQPIVVSIPTFFRLLHEYDTEYYTSVDRIPMKDFHIKMKSGISNHDIDFLKDSLQRIIALQSEPKLDVYDYRSAIQPIQQANIAIFIFFAFTIFITMTICFFSLMSSMYTNIFEQSKEIAVLRAVGISNSWLRRVYLFEGFILVFGSSLLGSLVGTFVAFTMALQQILFIQVPLYFYFPWQLILLILILSMIFATISSLIPMNQMLKTSIISNMKM